MPLVLPQVLPLLMPPAEASPEVAREDTQEWECLLNLCIFLIDIKENVMINSCISVPGDAGCRVVGGLIGRQPPVQPTLQLCPAQHGTPGYRRGPLRGQPPRPLGFPLLPAHY